MPKRQANSALLTEGCRSYHKALFAVMQFRREAQEAIRAAVDERIDDIAAALRLDQDELSSGLLAYAKPANLGQSWDGSVAEVGFRYPGKPWQTKWGVWFYFGIGDGEEGRVYAYCWFKEPGLAIQKLVALGTGVETRDRQVWIWESLAESSDGFRGAVERVLDRWIAAWREVGGIQQFLPPPK
jgi:hypothetical protein